MKASLHSQRSRQRRAGFTLVEMSAAMSVMLVLGVTLLIMLRQHAEFLEMFRQQAFLSSEAPKVGNMLGRMLNQADHYFVYASKEDAMGDGAPILGEGPAVKIFFKAPNQETEERLIVKETVGTGAALRFYSPTGDDTWTSWTISNRISNAAFQSSQGVLNMTLSGPDGEQITYGGGVR